MQLCQQTMMSVKAYKKEGKHTHVLPSFLEIDFLNYLR